MGHACTVWEKGVISELLIVFMPFSKIQCSNLFVVRNKTTRHRSGAAGSVAKPFWGIVG